MSSVERIYFSPAPPFNDLPKDQNFGKQKEEEKGTRDTPIFSLENHRWHRKKHFWSWLSKEATVVSDQSDRINDQEHKKTGEQKKNLLEKNNPSATEKKREQSS